MHKLIEDSFLAITYACFKLNYYILYMVTKMSVLTQTTCQIYQLWRTFEHHKNNRLTRLKLKLLNYHFTLKHLSDKKWLLMTCYRLEKVVRKQSDDRLPQWKTMFILYRLVYLYILKKELWLPLKMSFWNML